MKHVWLMMALLAPATALQTQAGPSADCSRVQQVAGSDGRMTNDSTVGTRDFSAIDSREKAEELFRRGGLEKAFLFPLDFGGEDIAPNILYVPIGVAALKARIENEVIGPMVDKGEVTQYSARPEYQGRSVIPIAITIRAHDPGEFTCTIHIWGGAKP
ncbi:MAG: hypothetical protein ACJ8GN_20675 [Longimicrobiaceae bacterium]